MICSLKTRANIFICLLDHALEVLLANIKGGQKTFYMGEVWNPVCCHGNGTVKHILWSTYLLESYCQKSKKILYKLAEISLFIMFEQNLVECMTSSLG